MTTTIISGRHVLTHEIVAGPVYQDSNVTVTAIPVPHANWRRSFGYRFETPDRVIVVSADRFSTRSPEWRRYHADAHTSTTELAALATRSLRAGYPP